MSSTPPRKGSRFARSSSLRFRSAPGRARRAVRRPAFQRDELPHELFAASAQRSAERTAIRLIRQDPESPRTDRFSYALLRRRASRFARHLRERCALAVAAPDGIFLSLSGRGDWAALAVAPTPVGVDLEPLGADATTATDLFAPEDRAKLDGLDARERRLESLRVWLAKEAFAKRSGRRLDDVLVNTVASRGPAGGVLLRDGEVDIDVRLQPRAEVLVAATAGWPEGGLARRVGARLRRFPGASSTEDEKSSNGGPSAGVHRPAGPN